MSVVIAVQESSEIEVMLDPNTKDANNKAASSKKSKTKPSSAKAKTSKKTKQGTTAQALPATQALPGNDVKTCGERRALLGPERKAAMRKGAKRAAQKFLVFMVSTVGLSCLVVAYAIVGGFIFMNLEGTAEQESRTAIKAIRERHVENLLNVTWNMNIFRKEEWRMEANKTFLEFQEEIYHAVKDMGWDGSDNVREKNTQWTYAGSLLFSVTVITTIAECLGYGSGWIGIWQQIAGDMTAAC
ncbi:hypothetical protein BaRGS_00032327 [Batillaria attramentaria]|uniref:TWiK family of potassium channels protein 7 n=1 Tax=Batillaria attramentaria TaxID=370345 RepID=A0ABD0JPK6_9CAEN